MMRNVILFVCLVMCMSIHARKYPFDMKHTYEIEVVRVDKEGYKFCKVWGIARSVDKAMVQAQQDAVAASLFTGVPGNEHASSIPAICGSADIYKEHQKYFDEFFKSGEFLLYLRNVNSNYPSGENNVKYKGKRKVGLYVQIKYDELRKKMENDGIIKGLDDFFE